ncbi:MAG TPA: methyltransferase domain-containing protein [Actinomycetes bacterium]|nr:methyltransferase domain-containing protein [Actinomycetes bacterium]
MTDHRPVEYRYPDPGERLTLQVIADSGLSVDAWEGQESQVLDALTDPLATLAPPRRLLDFGSGVGRLALRLAGLFDQVTSIEPDPDRARAQVEAIAVCGLADRIQVRTNGLGPADHGQFDAVICSHVLQHVDTAAASSILDELAIAPRPDGYLLVLTTLTSSTSERFTIERLDADNRLLEQEVSRSEFDLSCRSNEVGRLPVRFFSYSDLTNAFARRSLRLVASYLFHGGLGVVGPLIAPPALTNPPVEPLPWRDIAILARR